MRSRTFWDEWEKRANTTLVGRQGLLVSMDNLEQRAELNGTRRRPVEIVEADSRLQTLTTHFELGPLDRSAGGVINAARTANCCCEP